MITRATCTLGEGDDGERNATTALAILDHLTDEGEPVVSAYRTVDDGPWVLDVLFADTAPAAQARWLSVAQELVPGLPHFQLDPLAERDWVAESQRALHPVRAGRFVIHGSHDTWRLPPSRWRIEIDAGRAFGTAHHASTKGCLLALEALACCEPLGTVHDVGTGTGVLAIAADKLGAERVTAGDIDDVAVRVAKANVKANRTVRPIAIRAAAGPYATADVVVANILARPLIAMAPRLAASARRSLVLSGLRRRDTPRVEAAFRARGLAVDGRIVIEDWVTITMRRLMRGELKARVVVRGTGSPGDTAPARFRGHGRG
ncbi:MAG: 50S ribosomal protein L11 methyltransferase [Pseudomonadota bacterium]